MTQEEIKTLRKCGKHVILEQEERRTKIWELKGWMRNAREMGMKFDRKVEERKAEEWTRAGDPLRLPSLERELSSFDSEGYSGTQELNLNSLLLKKQPESYSYLIWKKT